VFSNSGNQIVRGSINVESGEHTKIYHNNQSQRNILFADGHTGNAFTKQLFDDVNCWYYEVISKVNEITIIDFFKNEFQLKTHDFINHICSISIFDIFFSKIYMKTSFLGYNNAILP
jgi:prepilin-type processing-associated H-X9-DG protein